MENLCIEETDQFVNQFDLEYYDDETLKKIVEKKSHQLTKSQKKEKRRTKEIENKKINEKQKRKEKQKRRAKNLIESLAHLTSEERKKWYAQRKQKRQETIQRTIDAVENDQTPKLIFDLSYGELMTTHEKKSLCAQISHTVSVMRQHNKPFGIHIVNSDDEEVNELFVQRGVLSWPVKTYETSLLKSFNSDGQKYTLNLNQTFYLSPDAEEALIDFDDNTNFILGGLIDRTVVKFASLEQSQKLNIQARRLPIEEKCKGIVIKKALSLNQVAEILLVFRETKDWRKAFEQVIPQRLQKDGEEQQDNQQQDNEEQSDSNENSINSDLE